MTLEGFQDAVATAKTGADLDALELQMIAIGHAHDGALRQSVAERRRALGAPIGDAVRDAHHGHLVARAAMFERMAAAATDAKDRDAAIAHAKVAHQARAALGGR